ncbi:hypothetical protein AOCH_000475 [Aspergillus ochraceoroseus]|uniref:Cytochrome P450 n=1 Tax=Aspergillus ochraceoroseus TaxID=138278 RepID=A0A0F8UPZ0_9EURO|nr:hypothetical protein AOCH_000475 [Aspergillus ochraceoroseus]
MLSLWAPSSNSLLVHAFCLLVISQVLVRWYKYYCSWVKVPVVGARGLIASRKEGLAWLYNGPKILQEGYEKHGDFAFQFRTPHRWEVCLCDNAMIKEYQDLNDDYMSLNAFNEGIFETKYTVPGFADSLHHIPVPVLSKALVWSRARSTANNSYFEELVSELDFALAFEMRTTTGGKIHFEVKLNCLTIGLRLMLRLISKVLVGDPLCRDPAAIDLFTRYGSAVPVSGGKIAWLPEILKPVFGPYFAASRMQVQLTGLITDQIQRTDKKADQPRTIGEWMWMWVQQDAPGEYNEVHVAQLLIAAIFGSVHSAGMVLATCLYELTIRPEYIKPLREEVEGVLREHDQMGKEAIESMTMLDSFIKECQRYRPLTPASLHRVAIRDYTFKNGLTIPKGTYVLTPNTPVLRDSRYYDNPHEFQGFRFHELGKATGRPDSYKIAGQSPKSRQFGDGRHSCPGKQLAADMLRLIMAHFLLNFDIESTKPDPACDYPSFDSRWMSVKGRDVK